MFGCRKPANDKSTYRTCSVKANAVISGSGDMIEYDTSITCQSIFEINVFFDKQIIIMVGKWLVPLISDEQK